MEFIKKAFQKHQFKKYKIILVDCEEKTLKTRLKSRGQSELFTPTLKIFLEFIRHEANRFKIPILNTTNLSKEKMVQQFE